MSYNLEHRQSPSFTPNGDAQVVYGRPRSFVAIAIHWWGDPTQNPTYEGVVTHLCNPDVQVSAHYVATGTGRRVAQLVNENDIAWATNKANPYTIAIECDPRCRNEDYDVVAELIADIWSRHGFLSLVPHNKFVSTRCPGDYDLGRLEELASKKFHGEIKGDTTSMAVNSLDEQEIKALTRFGFGRDPRTEDEWKYWEGRTLMEYLNQSLAADDKEWHERNDHAVKFAEVEADLKRTEKERNALQGGAQELAPGNYIVKGV